jgi:hypothetical protein
MNEFGRESRKIYKKYISSAASITPHSNLIAVTTSKVKCN